MTALPVLWAALVLAGAWRVRPRPPWPSASRPAGGVRARGAAVTVAVAIGAVSLPLPLAIGAALGLVAAPRVLARRAVAARAAAVDRSLPEVVELVHLAISAGLTVPLAVDAVVRRSSGPVVDELAVALDEVRLGRRLGDALSDVPGRTTDAVRPLIAALVASERYGATLAEPLLRLADDVRADRRRRAEEAARRIPVKLLFPLVFCVLPAFGLLTLAPLIAGAVAALRL